MIKTKKPLDIYAIIKDDITSIIMRKYHPDMLDYEYSLEWERNPPTGKNWKRVLHEIYIKSPGQYGGGNPLCTDDNPLAKTCDLTGEELFQTTTFLIEHELISLESSHAWRLMRSGFNVALRNEEIKSDDLIKWLLVVCAIISLFISLISIFI